MLKIVGGGEFIPSFQDGLEIALLSQNLVPASYFFSSVFSAPLWSQFPVRLPAASAKCKKHTLRCAICIWWRWRGVHTVFSRRLGNCSPLSKPCTRLLFFLFCFFRSLMVAISRSAASSLRQMQKTHLAVCHLHLVEVEGVEPTSETESSPTSTSVVCLLNFPLKHLNKRSYLKGSFIDTPKPQSFGLSVGTFYLPLCKARVTGAHITRPG